MTCDPNPNSPLKCKESRREFRFWSEITYVVLAGSPSIIVVVFVILNGIIISGGGDDGDDDDDDDNDTDNNVI